MVIIGDLWSFLTSLVIGDADVTYVLDGLPKERKWMITPMKIQ